MRAVCGTAPPTSSGPERWRPPCVGNAFGCQLPVGLVRGGSRRQPVHHEQAAPCLSTPRRRTLLHARTRAAWTSSVCRLLKFTAPCSLTAAAPRCDPGCHTQRPRPQDRRTRPSAPGGLRGDRGRFPAVDAGHVVVSPRVGGHRVLGLPAEEPGVEPGGVYGVGLVGVDPSRHPGGVVLARAHDGRLQRRNQPEPLPWTPGTPHPNCRPGPPPITVTWP
jgi:hypothetical protein